MQRRRIALGLAGLAAASTVAAVAGASAYRTGESSPFAIAFDSDRDGNSEIYVMNADGTGQTRLTYSAPDDAAPSWSPGAEEIAFASNRDGNWEIYRMRSDGTAQTRLTESPAGDYDPVWSPDGERLAFESHRDGNWNVYVMDADGDNERALTTAAGDEFDPVWLNGGQLGYAARGESGRYAIYVADIPQGEWDSSAADKAARVTTGVPGEFDPVFAERRPAGRLAPRQQELRARPRQHGRERGFAELHSGG